MIVLFDIFLFQPKKRRFEYMADSASQITTSTYKSKYSIYS